MGNCISSSKPSTPVELFVAGKRPVLYADADGSAQLKMQNSRSYVTDFHLNRPGSPRAQQTLAGLERRFFESACNAPELDFKPRANLRKHFCKYNAPQDHGPLPQPSERTRQNPIYQMALANNPSLPC